MSFFFPFFPFLFLKLRTNVKWGVFYKNLVLILLKNPNSQQHGAQGQGGGVWLGWRPCLRGPMSICVGGLQCSQDVGLGRATCRVQNGKCQGRMTLRTGLS